MSYNPLEFKSNFSDTRNQMIEKLSMEDAAYASNLLNKIIEPLKNELPKIDPNVKSSSKYALWCLFRDLSDELEKLGINCLFQSTMLSITEQNKPNGFVQAFQQQMTGSTPAERIYEERKKQQEEQVKNQVDDYTNPTSPETQLFTPEVKHDSDDEGRDRNLFSNSRSPRNNSTVKEAEALNKRTETYIKNEAKYKYLLKIDTVSGVIFIVSNRSSAKELKISMKVVPVTEAIKNKFTKDRTGYSNKDTNPVYDFTASYISRKDNEKKYLTWEQYIYETYHVLTKDNNNANL